MLIHIFKREREDFMKKIINYEKDILFKTNIGELTSISLEHDFTVDDGVLRGDFLVSGEYKPNELSVNKEPFEYRLPLEYELEPTVDYDTLSYDIDDFEYTVKDDCLTVYIDFGIRYEEKAIEPIIPTITEDELNDNADDIELPKLNMDREPEKVEDMPLLKEDTAVATEDTEQNVIREEPLIQDDRLDEEDKNAVVESFVDIDEYVTYHVHIVREGDTLESIAEKYGCDVDLIKRYNDFDSLEEKLKLLIPETKDE